MTNFTILPKWYPIYAFPILFGTIILTIHFGKGITWWDKFRVHIARARESLPDEETGDEVRRQPPGSPHTPTYITPLREVRAPSEQCVRAKQNTLPRAVLFPLS